MSKSTLKKPLGVIMIELIMFLRLKMSLTIFLACGVCLLTGCDESPSASATRRASESVDHAQRLMRASRQDINMTDAEMARASELTPTTEPDPQARRLARTVANRILSESLPSFEKTMAEIDQLLRDLTPGDDDALTEVSQKLLVATRQLSRLADSVNNLHSNKNAQRLEDAGRKLRDAISYARQTQQNASQIAPELTAATLQFMLARNHRTRLERFELVSMALRTVIGRITFPVVTEQAYDVALESYRPDPTIAVLSARLQGDPDTGSAGCREELAGAQVRMERLQAQFEQVEKEIATHTAKATQIQQQYLALLNQADKLPPFERFTLQKQAYDLRGGAGDSDGKNGIYYEVQAELAENRRAVISSRLNIARLQHRQLVQLTAQTEQELSDYSESAIFQEISDARRESNLRREQFIGQLSNLIDELIAAESDYAVLRLDAVTAYREAIGGYERVYKLERRGKTAQYAQEVMRLAKTELAALWRADALHYQITSASLAMLDNFPQLAGTVMQVRQTSQELAMQAQASAAELDTESDSTEY